MATGSTGWGPGEEAAHRAIMHRAWQTGQQAAGRGSGPSGPRYSYAQHTARNIARQISEGTLSYGQLGERQRRFIKRGWGVLTPAMRRAYTASKGEYTIQKTAKGIFKYTPLGFGLFASKKIAEKGKEFKEGVEEGYKKAEFGLPTPETVKQVPGLRGIAEIGEQLGMKTKMWVSEGVKQREVAGQIATTGFGVGGGKSYAQREAEIEADLGLSTRTLEQYTRTVSDLAETEGVQTYYETPQPLKPEPAGWKAEYESERRRGIELGWITEAGELKSTSGAATKFQTELYATWQEGQKYLTSEGYFKEGAYGVKHKPESVKRFEREMKHITRYEAKHGEGAFERHLDIFSRKAATVAQLSEFAMRSEVPPTEPSGKWEDAPSKLTSRDIGKLMLGGPIAIAFSEPYKYTKPIYERTQTGLKSYHDFLYKEAGWGSPLPKTPVVREFVGTGRYVGEKVPEFLSMFPMAIPAGEAIFREPQKMAGALAPGTVFMGRGMAREFYKEPVGFTATMIALAAITKGAAKVSPLKSVSLQVPTGKGQIKTWRTIGKGLPREFKALQEIAGYKTPLEVGKIEPTRIPGIYKQTHLIPEAVTYKGLYFRTPTRIPYEGKHFLIGRITGPPGTLRGWQIGQPKFELPTSYRVFTPVEAAATLPSMKASLGLKQQQLMTEAFYLQQRLWGRHGIVKPLKYQEVGTFEGAPEGFLRESSAYIRAHRRSLVQYGSTAKESQIARLSGERGGISMADLDFEIRTLAARMSEGIILPKRWQSAYTLGRLGIPTWKSRFIKRIGEKIPGLTPEKMAADLTAISEKYFGKESTQISYKPQWQMYSIEKIAGWKKTPLGKEAVTETSFDIHPESATFEFGIKPLKPIKTTIETGFGEGWWARHQKIRMTTLGEEFEHSFVSIMQTQMKGGELYLAPRFKRMKDIPRFVQTGKMLSEFERLKIETGIIPFKKYRLRGIGKEEMALKHWEEYGSTFKELREFQADMIAKAIPASAESLLKQQRISASLFASETATAFQKRIKFEEAYKPEIGKPRVGIGRKATGDYYEAYGYPTRPSGYYGAGYYYGASSYYGKPGYRGVPPSYKVFGFVSTPPIKHVPTTPPAHIVTSTTITTPPSRHRVTPPPTTQTITTITSPRATPIVTPPPTTTTPPPPPQPPPPTTPAPPPTPPPTDITAPPPPPPFTIPPPVPPFFMPFWWEEKKLRREKKYKRKAYFWGVKNPIPSLGRMLQTDMNKINREMERAMTTTTKRKRVVKRARKKKK